MPVYVDAGPIVASVITVSAAGITALWRHSVKRENRQATALENVRTDIKGDVSKWADAVLQLTKSLGEVEKDVAYLKGVRSGEESARAKTRPRTK